MTMFALNFKSFASAVAALTLTVVLSWAFVTGTQLELAQRGSGQAFLVAASALVR
jgi:hypothetical protein